MNVIPLDFLFVIIIAAAIATAVIPPIYIINELSVPPLSGIGCVNWAEAKVLM